MTTQKIDQTATSSTGVMSVEDSSRGMSERGLMLHHPTGTPSAYPMTPGRAWGSQGMRLEGHG